MQNERNDIIFEMLNDEAKLSVIKKIKERIELESFQVKQNIENAKNMELSYYNWVTHKK